MSPEMNGNIFQVTFATLPATQRHLRYRAPTTRTCHFLSNAHSYGDVSRRSAATLEHALEHARNRRVTARIEIVEMKIVSRLSIPAAVARRLNDLVRH